MGTSCRCQPSTQPRQSSARAAQVTQDTAAARPADSTGAAKLDALKANTKHDVGKRQEACRAQQDSLTWSSGSSEKELAPRSSPSWPGAPGCRVSEGDKREGKAWNTFQSFCLQPWRIPSSGALAGRHSGHLYSTAVMEGTPSVPEAAGCAGKQPTSSFTTCEEATQHTVLTWNRVKPT